MYDYQRIDPQTGSPRPIHLKMAEDVIHKERDAKWVEDNLVNHGGVIRSGDGWCEKIVGEHALLYFSLRNLVLEREIEDDTKGTFHVLSLVDGEKIKIESLDHPQLHFEMKYLDIAVVPADFGKYRIVNEGVGTVVVHKTLLKE